MPVTIEYSKHPIRLSKVLAHAAYDQHSATSSPLEVKRVRDLDISEVVRRSAIPASTLRFYEEKGLIASVGRRGLHRQFDPSVLERLALVTLGRSAGFSLEEIARMFAPGGRPQINRQMLVSKADELERTIRKLQSMRDGLRHAAACSAASHMECPTFRRLLGLAAVSARKKKRLRKSCSSTSV
jgi:DNA-binding transcriptional MerR regulator